MVQVENTRSNQRRDLQTSQKLPLKLCKACTVLSCWRAVLRLCPQLAHCDGRRLRLFGVVVSRSAVSRAAALPGLTSASQIAERPLVHYQLSCYVVPSSYHPVRFPRLFSTRNVAFRGSWTNSELRVLWVISCKLVCSVLPALYRLLSSSSGPIMLH